MKAIKSNRVFRTMYYLITLFFFLHLFYFLVNLFLNYSVPFDKKSEFTIRGHISLIENNWKPMEVNSLNARCKPIFLLYKSGFVRFDFDNWKDAFNTKSVLHILFYNLWLLMGLLISFQLYMIFRSLIKTKVFEKVNTRRLRLVAATIILMPFIKNLSQMFFLSFARTNFSIEGHTIHLPQNHSFYNFPYLPYILVGLLIFAIVEIFKEGMRLQSETDLTI